MIRYLVNHNIKSVFNMIADLVAQANQSLDQNDDTAKICLSQILNQVDIGKKLVGASIARQELLTKQDIAVFRDKHAHLLNRLNDIEELNANTQ